MAEFRRHDFICLSKKLYVSSGVPLCTYKLPQLPQVNNERRAEVAQEGGEDGYHPPRLPGYTNMTAH